MPWWVALVQGIAAVIIGIVLMTYPAAAAVTFVYFVGWWWLISGIFELGSILVDRTAWGWRALSGALSVLAGGYIITAPLVGTVIVVGVTTILLGVGGMIIGVLDVAKAFQGAGWGKAILGVLSFTLGAVIAFNWTVYILALLWAWGLLVLIGGVASIVMSLGMRRVEHNPMP